MTSAIRHPAGDLDARPAPALAMHLVLSTAHLTENVAQILDDICDTPDNRERPCDPTGTWADEVVSSPYRYGCWVRPFLDADQAEFPAITLQPFVGVVITKRQPVLRARGEDALALLYSHRLERYNASAAVSSDDGLAFG